MSRQDLPHHLAIDVGEAEIATLVAPRELLVIKTEEVQDGGVEVVQVDFSRNRTEAEFIGQPEGMELPARFEAVPLAKFPFQAVCLATSPFAAIRKPTLRDLLRQPLILAGEASSSRMQFDHLVARAGLTDRVNICLTANNLALILNYVAIGMGVALITRPAREATPIPPELEQQLAFRDLSHILGHEQVVLLHPRGRHELSHVRAFRERVVAVLG